jgi:Tfp pilus assembly ATPase PilU
MSESTGYSMEDLLELILQNDGECLRCHAGARLVLIRLGEEHVVEGPDISPENAEELLREIADERRMAEFQMTGRTEFAFVFRRDKRFHASASNVDGAIHLELKAFD